MWAWTGLQRQWWASPVGARQFWCPRTPRELHWLALLQGHAWQEGGRVGGLNGHSHYVPLNPFQELCALYFMVLLWQMKNQTWSTEILGLQKHLRNGNQWMPPLMEGLVFFMVLITSKLRIRKSLCSGITGDWDLGYLGKRCCQPF